MVFDFAASEYPVRPAIGAAMVRDWARLASPGTWWRGDERVAIAAEARAVLFDDPAADHLDEPVRRVVRKVAADSPRIDEHWVAALPVDVDVPAYTEIIGIVARLSSVDFFHLALGLDRPDLPEPRPGDPTRVPSPRDVVVGKSFVPMVAPVSIPQTVSIVPPETVAWQELSDATYMTFREMDRPDFERVLHRTQIELVAARTSHVNECFY